MKYIRVIIRGGIFAFLLLFAVPSHAVEVKYVTSFETAYGASGYLQWPQGMAVDSAGNLFVADMGAHAIVVFDRYGKIMFASGGKPAPGMVSLTSLRALPWIPGFPPVYMY